MLGALNTTPRPKAEEPKAKSQPPQPKAEEPKQPPQPKVEDEKQIHVIDTTEAKKPKPKSKVGRTELTRCLKDYRATFPRGAIQELFAQYDASCLSDIPEDKYPEVMASVKDAFQKLIIDKASSLGAKAHKALTKEFGVERLTDASDQFAAVVAAIDAAAQSSEDSSA
jgi:hypothetical protein